DGPARVCGASDGKEQAVLAGQNQPISFFQFAPGGKTLATVDEDGTVKLWDPATGKERAHFTGFQFVLRQIRIDKGPKPEMKMPKEEMKPNDPARPKDRAAALTSPFQGLVTFSPDGKVLMTRDAYTVRLWDAATGKPLASLADVADPCFSADGKSVAARTRDGALKRWDVAGGKERAVLQQAGQPV